MTIEINEFTNLNIKDTAELINLDRRALSNRIKLGDNPDYPDVRPFPHDHYGDLVRIPKYQLEEYLKNKWEPKESCPDKWHEVEQKATKPRRLIS